MGGLDKINNNANIKYKTSKLSRTNNNMDTKLDIIRLGEANNNINVKHKAGEANNIDMVYYF